MPMAIFVDSWRTCNHTHTCAIMVVPLNRALSVHKYLHYKLSCLCRRKTSLMDFWFPFVRNREVQDGHMLYLCDAYHAFRIFNFHHFPLQILTNALLRFLGNSRFRVLPKNLSWMILHSLKTDSSHLPGWAIQKGNFIFQPSIFRFELLVSGRIIHII